MNANIDSILKIFVNQWYIDHNAYKQSVGELLCHTPLTVEIFNIICNRLPQYYESGQWFLDEFGKLLWEKSKNSEEWKLWGGPKTCEACGFLDLDAVLAGSDGSGRWFDHFAYRWNENSLETLNEKHQIKLQVFFDTAWHYAIRTKNIIVLKKMFGNNQWCTALNNRVSGLHFPLNFEFSTVEIVNLLVQSKAIPFETILHNQLKRGYGDDILQFLLNDPRATPECVVQQYIEHWNGPYRIEFSKILSKLTPNSATTDDLDAFHNTVVHKCFSKRRRELPYHTPELFVTWLKNTPLLDEVKFMSAIVNCIDTPNPEVAWPEILNNFVHKNILETFVNSMSQSDLGCVITNHPNNEFLQEFPRWQKHILLQQIDLQCKDLQSNASERRKI